MKKFIDAIKENKEKVIKALLALCGTAAGIALVTVLVKEGEDVDELIDTDPENVEDVIDEVTEE